MFMDPPDEKHPQMRGGRNGGNFVYSTHTHKDLTKNGRTTLLCMTFQPLVQALIKCIP